MPPFGGVTFSNTSVDALVVVQPFIGSVTVKVYNPGSVTNTFCVDAVNPFGPLQAYVAPGVDDVPKIVTLVVVQVNGPLLLAVTPVGGIIFSNTSVDALVVVHPFTGSVTVKL